MEGKPSAEIVDIFSEPDFEKLLKTLATEFGSTATLHDVHESFRRNRPLPKQVINGKEYSAGYWIIEAGNYFARLIDIKQHGAHCKLMFEICGKVGNFIQQDSGFFLYHNYPVSKLKVEQVVRLAQYMGHKFPVTVEQETIPQTGDKHSLVSFVDGLEQVLAGPVAISGN